MHYHRKTALIGLTVSAIAGLWTASTHAQFPPRIYTVAEIPPEPPVGNPWANTTIDSGFTVGDDGVIRAPIGHPLKCEFAGVFEDYSARQVLQLGSNTCTHRVRWDRCFAPCSDAMETAISGSLSSPSLVGEEADHCARENPDDSLSVVPNGFQWRVIVAYTCSADLPVPHLKVVLAPRHATGAVPIEFDLVSECPGTGHVAFDRFLADGLTNVQITLTDGTYCLGDPRSQLGETSHFGETENFVICKNVPHGPVEAGGPSGPNCPGTVLVRSFQTAPAHW